MDTYDLIVFGLLALVVWLFLAWQNQKEQTRRERMKRELMATLAAEMNAATIRNQEEQQIMQAQAGGDGFWQFLLVVLALFFLWGAFTGNLPLL